MTYRGLTITRTGAGAAANYRAVSYRTERLIGAADNLTDLSKAIAAHYFEDWRDIWEDLLRQS